MADAVAAIKSSGAISDVETLANSLISQAYAILEGLPGTPERKLLRSWASYLLARQY